MSTLNSYVSALFELSKDKENLTNEILNFFKKDVIRFDNEMISFFANKSIIFSKKEELISEVISDGLLLNFLLVIIKDNLFSKIKIISSKFISLVNKEKNISEGIIWTADFLEKSEVDKIKNIIQKKLNRNIYLENKIDKLLIGGVKVEIKDYIFDNTIKTQLQNLRKDLMK